MKFMEYILNRGGKPKVEALPAPGCDPKGLSDYFNSVFKHEVDDTEKMYALVDLAFKEKKWATWNFL
ncbi:hypothetical protein JI747_012520 [Chryseobacterium sp. RG1]|uniref:Ferritin/DPS domain-containing protein n=1 Tax=Chryseobacterium tagetis TaxID=2801334 RepID=A0ABS8A5P0_9FLAO|nr:hypothetical protein [Chryseobacterium tagetis]